MYLLKPRCFHEYRIKINQLVIYPLHDIKGGAIDFSDFVFSLSPEKNQFEVNIFKTKIAQNGKVFYK